MNRRKSTLTNLYECPCCGYAVFEGVDLCEICEICYWEDDGSDDNQPPEDARNNLLLEQARINYLICGASERKWVDVVRKPTDNDTVLREFTLENGVAIERKKT